MEVLNIKNGVVYKYVDIDDIVKYVGLVKPGNSFLTRTEQHKSDQWFHDGFKIFYIELETQTDCEFCESFFINYYKTFDYYNIAKSSWGGSSLINADDFTWKQFDASDFKNEYIKRRKRKDKNRFVSERVNHKAYISDLPNNFVFAKIPKEIVLDNSLGKKRILFTLAIQFLKNKADNVYTTITEFVEFCGYKPDRHDGKINQEVKWFLQSINNIYIENLSIEKDIRFKVLPAMESPKQFSIIRYSEFEVINNNVKCLTKSLALLLLAYVRIYMNRNTNVQKKNAEMYFDHLDNIIKKIDGLEYRSLKSIISILDCYDILYNDQMPRYKDKHNHWHSAVTIFVEKHRFINGFEEKNYDYKKEMAKAKKEIYNLQQRFLNDNK